MRRLVLAAAALSIAGAACARTEPAPASATASPSALAGDRFCVVTESPATATAPAQTRVEAIDACTGDDGTVDPDAAFSRVAVANADSEQVLIVDMDLRDPRFIDLDASIPGSNGLIVPKGPSALASVAHPAIVAVGSEAEPGLAFIDIAYARPVPIELDGQTIDHLALDAPIGGLEGHDDILVWWFGATREIASARVTVTCGGEVGRVASDCAPVVQLETLASLRLDAPPLNVALGDDGSAYVTRRGRDDVAVIGLFEPRLADVCGGSACVVQRLAAAPECADGLDNDGDGVADGDDPQCFSASDDEAGYVLPTEALSACSNGVDDDGDGIVDADDPDCFRADQRREGPRADDEACTNGFDDDFDGLIDADDPACQSGGTSEFERGTDDGTSPAVRSAPRCADGEDNDDDGLTDWPDDPDCFGPSSDSESAPVPTEPDLLTLTEAGDYLVVVDVSELQLLVYDLTNSAQVDPHALIPWRSTPGLSIRRALPVAIVASELVNDVPIDEDERSMQLVERVIHVATTSGVTYTFDLDRTWTLLDANGAALDTEVIDRFQRRDVITALAEVDGVNCDVPREALNAYNELDIECDDDRLPQPELLNPDLATADATTYALEDGDAFGSLPRRLGYTNVPNDGDGFARPLDEFLVDLPWDYATGDDDWDMIYEGVLPGTDRDDAIFGDDGWVEILGADPCEVEANVCTLGLNFDDCPEARELCSAGADLCEDRYHVCRICPEACSGAADLCASGVVDGDRMIIRRLSAGEVDDPACAPFAVASAQNTDATIGPLEYEVIAVRPGAVRIAPVPDAASFDPPLPTTLPPASCYDAPFDVEIRAGGSWIAVGDDTFGHTSPWVDSGGFCELAGDADLRAARPRENEPWTGFYGLTMQINSGDDPAQRDFRIRYSVDSNFQDRDFNNLQLLVGSRTSDMVEVDTDRGPRLIIADEAQDFVHVYNARTFFEVDAPLP